MDFVVDELLGESHYETGFPSLAQAAEELGHSVYRCKYKPIIQTIEGDLPPSWGCVVAYGTVQFCRQFEKIKYTPGLYFNKNVKHFSKYAVHIGKDLLNDDYIILPYGEVKRRASEYFPFFIKPESGLKEFVGQVLSKEEDFDLLVPHGSGICDDVLCIIAAPQDIKAEFRYVIADRTVVTGSEYRWDDILDVRIDTDPLCDALGEKIAKADWQADTVYVCDIALLHNDVAKVIELNAFSSSGLYACDTYKIVKAVAEAAMKERYGED